jgi:colanic acid/amylovoran biosynthesis glycosyltransferase
VPTSPIENTTGSLGETIRRAAVFNTNYLPHSQTFVYEQLVNHERYEAEVFCWRTTNLDWFPFDHVHRANVAYGLTRYSPAFFRRFRDEPFNIVHAHFATGAVYALPYVQRFELPFVVTFHGYDVPLFWNAQRFEPEFWPFLLHSNDVLERMTLGLCASTDLKELLVSHGVPEDKLRVHRLGIDLTRFTPRETSDAASLRICLIGRFVEKKGIEYAIRAYAPHASDKVLLDIVGDGPLTQDLRALVTRLSLDRFVSFLGVLHPDEVAKHLSACDMLLAPSVVTRSGDRESGLIVAKEAAACGIPVIATMHGGLPDIVDDGSTGFLVPERDVARLSERVGRLIADPALRRRMGAAGRLKMEHEYDVRERVAELEHLYDEAILKASDDPAR